MAQEETEFAWFYLDQNRARQGPYSVPQFQALAAKDVIRAETLIWTKGYENWIPASQLEGLVKAQEPHVAEIKPPPDSPDLPSAEAQQESKTAPTTTPANDPLPDHSLPDEELKPRKGSFIFPRAMSGLIWGILLGIIAAVGCHFLAFTPWVGVLVFLLILAPRILGALAGYRKERYEFSATTVRCHRGGLVSDQTTEVDICNITHVAMKLPWLRFRLFGIGDITIESAGSATPLTLQAIKTPRETYQRIRERMQQNGYQLLQKGLLHEESPPIRGIIVNCFQIGMKIAILLLFSWSTVLTFYEGLTSLGLAWVISLLVALFSLTALAYLIVYFLDMRNRVYRVYDDAVVYEEGFLTRRNAFIPYENIADAATHRSFLYQLFDLYDVMISCQGSATEIKFRCLQDGIHLSSCIEQLVGSANLKPSPGELMASRQAAESDVSPGKLPTRQEPTIGPLADPWLADLQMSPLRVFLPLLILLPLFPLWIIAMIQAGISLYATHYEVREGSVRHIYRFLNTKEREFAYDKITGLVIKRNLFDRIFGTVTLRFWSIGSGQAMEFSHLSWAQVDLDAILTQIGITTTSEHSHEVPTQFSLASWLRSRCYRFLLAFVACLAGAAGAFFAEENLLHLTLFLPPLLVLGDFILGWLFYSRQKLILQDHHIEAAQGILTCYSYFARYRNVKKTVATQYPGGSKGALRIFVAGEQALGQQGNQGKQKGIPVPCSFTLGHLPEVFSQGNLVDNILAGRLEVREDFPTIEPLELLVESKRAVGNSVLKLSLLSLILFPLLLLLPLTLPLRIWAVKRWRYRVEAGRVLADWGLIFQGRSSVLLDRVDSLQQAQGPLHKIFKNGNVVIMTAGSSQPDLVMPAAKDYQTLYQKIKTLSQKN